jgi:hypothetical protein
MKRGILSVKAINQYRSRDIVSYLGLRYYLENASACKDRWIKDVSTQISLDRKELSYFKSNHFKSIDVSGVVTHRFIHLPGPNEILAECALITELSRHKSFKPPPYVYSYIFSDPDSKIGVFEPYFTGYKNMHASITDACRTRDDGGVLYTDIQKFYPSISNELAVTSWREAVSNSTLENKYKKLGDHILESHRKTSEVEGGSKGLLTGPMLSHVVANLVLSKIDGFMHGYTNGNYWRYVDDIVFVGRDEQLTEWRAVLNEHLSQLGLDLHTGEKDFRVDASEWMESEGDFEINVSIPWISLIADTKRLLLSDPSSEERLHKSLSEHGFRIPVSSYSQAIRESTYIQRFSDWMAKYKWAKRSVESISVNSIIQSASLARTHYQSVLYQLLGQNIDDLSRYQRKRLIPKIRYYAGRLLYLMTDDDLMELSTRLAAIPEMSLISKIMNAVATRDVSEVVKLGSNATQSAAQILKTIDKPVKCTVNGTNEMVYQSISYLILNGISMEFEKIDGEFSEFARGENIIKLMNSDDQYIREVACLHGVSDPRHSEIFDEAFDRDEELIFDVISQLHNSSHG